MKSKIMFLAVLVMGMLILVACDGKEPSTQTGKAFIGGTQGIVASFEPLGIKEENVYTIFDTEDFPIDVVLKNKGEEDLAVGKATLKLLGPATEDFENIPSWELRNKEVIEKITEFNPDGGEEIISFTPNKGALYKSDVTTVQDIVWNLEYAYDYKTHLIINDVCFKGDATDTRVCTVKEPKTFSVSGAPITVTKIEEESTGRGVVSLKIDIKNAGSGDSTIVGQEFDRRFNQVSYTIDEPEKWECKSGGRENEAKLTEGAATIICRLKNPLNENDLYVKSVRLTLDYTYRDLIRETLRIKESIR